MTSLVTGLTGREAGDGPAKPEVGSSQQPPSPGLGRPATLHNPDLLDRDVGSPGCVMDSVVPEHIASGALNLASFVTGAEPWIDGAYRRPSWPVGAGLCSKIPANLEAQLGVSLFDREASRKPRLTDAGRAVLAEARAVANSVDGLRAKVTGLRQGLEAEVNLALDVMLPSARVVDALRAFDAAFPTVKLRLYVEALGGVTQMVLDRRATLGVSGPLDTGIVGLERIMVGAVDLIPVAAPTHPLALAEHNLPGAGRDHTQLVLTDRSSLTDGLEFAVVGARTWRLADLGSKHMLLKEGIGWGNMPEPMVREDIAAGRLAHLKMPDVTGGYYPLQAIYRSDTPPGPATAYLIQRFERHGSC